MDQTLNLLGQPLAELLGPRGAEWVRTKVTTGEYDPATTANEVDAARTRLNEARTKFRAATEALNGLEFSGERDIKCLSDATIQVRFTGDAEIRNIALLKKWSADWYDISRGIAMFAGGSPEEVRVLSAGRGSIIVTLATTAIATRILASIAKHVASIVHEGVKVGMAIESLRQQRLLTSTIEEELERQKAAVSEKGVDDILASLQKDFPLSKLQGDKKVAITRAVEKFLNFSNKGGEVDIRPPAIEDNSDETLDSLDDPIQLLKKEIADLRREQDSIRLLTDSRKQQG